MKTTVLLVEDSKLQKLMNERMLHRAGYAVLNASDGEEAVALLREVTVEREEQARPPLTAKGVGHAHERHGRGRL